MISPQLLTILATLACGFADTPAWAQQYILSTYAGGAWPALPAVGTSVPVGFPQAVAPDGHGNVYFTSAGLDGVFKLDTAGILTVAAGSGTPSSWPHTQSVTLGDNGPATAANLSRPNGVAVDAAGNVYIADTGNNLIRKVNTNGIITTAAGGGIFSPGDGQLAIFARLQSPADVAVDPAGNLYIADTLNFRVRKVDTHGFIATVAGAGSLAGTGANGKPALQARLVRPTGVAVSAGNLYVADAGLYYVYRVDPSGVITIVAGNGTSAGLYTQGGLGTDAAGNLYIPDTLANSIRKVDTQGIITTVAGNGSPGFEGDGGAAISASLSSPQGVAADTDGTLWIADTSNFRVREVDAAGVIATVAGISGWSYSGDGGPATSARLSAVSGVAVDAAGSLFIADTSNARVRKVSTAGIITTVAGNGVMGNSGNGGPATSAQLFSPSSVAVDSAGNLYIADFGQVRKVDTNGNIGIVLATDAAQPSSVAVDAAGNLYVADSSQRIRKIDTEGIVTTVAGSGTAGYSGDGGPATSARLLNPAGMVVNAAGDLFFSDLGNYRIRKVDAAGNITTVAGNGTAGYSGDGGQATSARLSDPSAIALDFGGNLLIADGAYVRKGDWTGTITTIASGLNGAVGIAAGAGGKLYVAEAGNDVVRLLAPEIPDLTVASTHSGTFRQGRTGAVYMVTVTNAGWASTSGTVTLIDRLPAALTATAMSGTGWNCALATLTCARGDTLAYGASYPPITLTVNVAADAPASVTNTATVSGGADADPADNKAVDVTAIAPALACTYALTPGSLTFPAAGDSKTVSVTAPAGCPWTASSPLGWVTLAQPTSGSGNGTVGLTAAPNTGAARSGTLTIAGLSFTVQQAGTSAAGARFVPVTPCRIADTRNPAGPFGGPAMEAGSTRSFPIPQSACGIPATAQAYSLNVTVVPNGRLSYLTLFPTGQNQPLVSTLNSYDGAVVANAAIVPAGTDGAVSVYVTDPTQVILDIDGYFDSADGSNSYSFYTVQPCRAADTRNPAGALGGPSLAANQSRDFPLPSSSCGLPPNASAYSLNLTVAPAGFLGYLATWATGQAQPLVSTLNSWSGTVVANAAIVPAGTNGSISVFATNPTDVILDANGYFAAPGSPGALSFYPVTPCRVADTRNAAGPFGGPELEAATARSFAIPASGCAIPSTAVAYSVNVTVVPDGPLSYLTVWPTGSPQSLVSTLNSYDGSVVANAAIVPAGTNGAISVFVTDPTHVILDINGYFAP